MYYREYRQDKVRMAIANIKGGPFAAQLKGTVIFTNVSGGAWVCAQISGLPNYMPGENGKQPVGPHGFHIHDKGNCEVGDPKDPFQGAGGHWNPTNQPHGNHAGDFPVLFSNNGMAKMCFFTDKFRIQDIIGKSVIIHESPDDYRSQPAGNSGRRLGCGVIKEYYRY
ncbi:MAG: superoxide dismutase family protein [Clostridiaceae bacterium]|jgi:Cu-Zn family superoxide dismutase|nr:superoxide dismutase family protein [Clostridiaceae bacterium]